MKKLRAYIGTSVIAGHFDDEYHKYSEGLLEGLHTGKFKPVISDVTAAEISHAPRELREKYLEVMKFSHDYLEVDREALELAEAYIGHGILPREFLMEALHIAVSAVGSVDMVLSWNFRRIVQFDNILRFNSVNIEHGYKVLQIFSPMEVTDYER